RLTGQLIPPGRGRLTVATLEGAVECLLGLEPNLLGNRDQGRSCAAQALRGDMESPPREVVHRRLTDQCRKPIAQSRSRKSDLAREPIEGPYLADRSMELGQSACDERIPAARK